MRTRGERDAREHHFGECVGRHINAATDFALDKHIRQPLPRIAFGARIKRGGVMPAPAVLHACIVEPARLQVPLRIAVAVHVEHRRGGTRERRTVPSALLAGEHAGANGVKKTIAFEAAPRLGFKFVETILRDDRIVTAEVGRQRARPHPQVIDAIIKIAIDIGGVTVVANARHSIIGLTGKELRAQSGFVAGLENAVNRCGAVAAAIVIGTIREQGTDAAATAADRKRHTHARHRAL